MKKDISGQMRECIHTLIEQTWVLKETDQELFYRIQDHLLELQIYFRDYFQWRLIETNDLIKLEKTPVKVYSWMGKGMKMKEKIKDIRDFVFLFYLFAFLERKVTDEQFTMQDIIEEINGYATEPIKWKGGVGKNNRFAFVRVLDFSISMNLIRVIDQHVNDFLEDDEHDVLIEKTVYFSHFIRSFAKDVTKFKSLEDVITFFTNENEEILLPKHTLFRRLFLEPIVYLDELNDDQLLFYKNRINEIEDMLELYTDYKMEKTKNAIMLVKHEYTSKESIFPINSIESKFVLSFAHYIKNAVHLQLLHIDFKGNVEIEKEEIVNIIKELRTESSDMWTISYREKNDIVLTMELLEKLEDLNMAEVIPYEKIILKDGLFRIIGDFNHQKGGN